jgi:cytochrome c oxidase subunit 3
MAPATVIPEEIELINTGSGGGNGRISVPRRPGGGGNGGDGGVPRGGGGDAAVPQRAYMTGMTVALAGILMFFMALVSAYIVRKGFPNGGWQPLEPPRILWLTTLVLLASSATIVMARRKMEDHDDAGFRYWWRVTIVLGLLFLAGQLLAWRELVHAGVYLSSNPSSSFFYLFTAAHGLHLLGGLIALVAVDRMRHPRHLTLGTASEVVAVYWHFMDGLWVFLFLLLIVGR